MGASCGFAGSNKWAPAGVAPSLRALVVRGAVARPRWSTLPARSSHGNRSPRPLPSRCWRRSSRPLRPTLLRRSAVVPPLCPPSAPPSLRYGVGGRVAPRSAPSAYCFKDAHPRLRLDRFEGGCRRFGNSICNRRAIPKVSSLRSKWFGEASSLAECSGWLVPRHLPPQTPLRCALHTLPALRPPQAAANMPGMRFGNVGREIEPCWLAQAPRPGFHVVFRSFLPAHHVPAPVPPPSAYGVKCCPRRSRRFRVPSFVPHCVTCAAWSLLRDHLTPQTPAAEGHYRFGFAKTSWVNLLGDDQTGSGQRLNPVES